MTTNTTRSGHSTAAETLTNGVAAQPEDDASESDAWSHQDVLDLDDFSHSEILTVLDLADSMKEVLERRIARVPALRGHTVVNLFYEPSTRTRASFELAGKVLGADVISVSASTSSVQKGESLIDTVRTLTAMGADTIVMRHASAGAPYIAARHTEASIVNAGDGAHAHPTQALLDLYTIRSHFGDLTGKRVVMIGDIAHSRVARSDLWGPNCARRGGRRLRPADAAAAWPLGLAAAAARRWSAAAGGDRNRPRARHRGCARGDGTATPERAPAGRPAAVAARVRDALPGHGRPAREGASRPPADAPRPEERRRGDSPAKSRPATTRSSNARSRTASPCGWRCSTCSRSGLRAS